MANLTCDDIRLTMQNGATLLDVRTTDEFHYGALPDAKNIPLAILPILADEHLDKNDHVLVYCRAGARAVMAEKILTGLGFTKVTNIGGIHQYQHCH
ncbi:MAG: rhodanese-like domain-containing protein [Gammaproteobacteria bacterium]|nr:rhodanese-like domain-containing protein [Gammaproteobacteria bacterium]